MSAPYKKTVLAVQGICGVSMVGTVVWTYTAAGFEKALIVAFVGVMQVATPTVWNKYVDRRYERETAANNPVYGALSTAMEKQNKEP